MIALCFSTEPTTYGSMNICCLFLAKEDAKLVQKKMLKIIIDGKTEERARRRRGPR